MIDGWLSGEDSILSTTRLVGENGTGTGFFFSFSEGDNVYPIIVTNRHVVEHEKKMAITFPIAKESKVELSGYEYIIANLQNVVIYHPDESVDLAAILAAGLLKDFHNTFNTSPDIKILSKENILVRDEYSLINSVENIMVVGYPNGLWDSYNLRPLVRIGITASDYRNDYENKAEFVIDSEIVPGSSGSPIFLRLVMDDFARFNVKPPYPSVLKLIGINFAVFTRNHVGDIQQMQENTKTALISGMPIGLGLGIKAEKILDFERILKKRGSKGV